MTMTSINLTQPMRVAIFRLGNNGKRVCSFQSNATRVDCNFSSQISIPSFLIFQSNATSVGCNSKLVQTKQQVVMYFVQCLSVF
jgi:hypothetical protein